jgi:hypothetical protein
MGHQALREGAPLKGKIDGSSSYAGNVFWYIFEMASKKCGI